MKPTWRYDRSEAEWRWHLYTLRASQDAGGRSIPPWNALFDGAWLRGKPSRADKLGGIISFGSRGQAMAYCERHALEAALPTPEEMDALDLVLSHTDIDALHADTDDARADFKRAVEAISKLRTLLRVKGA